jgi:hypothetical protein
MRTLAAVLTLSVACAGPRPAWMPWILMREAIRESRACAHRRDVDLRGAVLLGANFQDHGDRHWSLTWKRHVDGYGLILSFIDVFEDGRCTIRGAEG